MRAGPATWLAAAALAWQVTAPAASAPPGDEPYREPSPYVLGEGRRYPELGLNLGGYLSLRYRDLEEVPSSLGIKDLSLFVSREFSDRLLLFSELEIGEAVSISRHGVDTDGAEFEVERLYLDYRAAPEATLRLGKFLTPVGRWNLIHADPLVWTVSRPLTSTVSFAREAIGAMVYGAVPLGDNGLEYSLFADNTDLLDHYQQDENAYEDAGSDIDVVGAFKRAVGARLVYQLLDEHLQFGASFLRYRMLNLREIKDLYGLDVFWDTPYAELSAEWVYRHSRGAVEPEERGGFVQAAIPLDARLYLIGRYERYRTAVEPVTTLIHTLGLTYRPHRVVSLKLEYRDGDHNELVAPSGWLASLAVLF